MTDARRFDAKREERERFFELLERELADDAPLSREEREFARRMTEEDRECASFTSVVDELRAIPSIDPDLIDRAVSEHWRGKSSRGLRAAALCGVAVAAAAVVAFVIVGTGSREKTGPASSAHVPYALVERDGTSLGVGRAIDTGETPRLLRDGATLTVGLDKDSGLSIAAAERRVISLRVERGKAAFHLQPGSARGLRVITPICDVVVTGTVFSVAVESGEVEVDVVKGSVSIQNDRDGEIARVKAGEKLSVKGRNVKHLDAFETDRILSLLGMGERSHLSPPPAPTIDSAGEVGEGATAAKETKPDSAETPRRKVAGSEGEKADGVVAEGATPAELIRQARERVRARDWRRAAELYREIMSGYPGRPEAVTVRVSLADLEIDQLHEPGAALADYRGYLARAPNGPLAEDATWGTCLAFARLGQIAEEKRALVEFTRRFPQSLHARAAQDRLIQLEK
jgi:ferric-dicitrate binding protein FerR (iron transport regulator)